MHVSVKQCQTPGNNILLLFRINLLLSVHQQDFLSLLFLISFHLSSLALSCCIYSIIQWEASGRVYAWTAAMYGIVSSVVLLLSNPGTQTWPCGSLWTSTPWPSSHYCGQELPGKLDFNAIHKIHKRELTKKIW